MAASGYKVPPTLNKPYAWLSCIVELLRLRGWRGIRAENWCSVPLVLLSVICKEEVGSFGCFTWLVVSGLVVEKVASSSLPSALLAVITTWRKYVAPSTANFYTTTAPGLEHSSVPQEPWKICTEFRISARCSWSDPVHGCSGICETGRRRKEQTESSGTVGWMRKQYIPFYAYTQL